MRSLGARPVSRVRRVGSGLLAVVVAVLFVSAPARAQTVPPGVGAVTAAIRGTSEAAILAGFSNPFSVAVTIGRYANTVTIGAALIVAALELACVTNVSGVAGWCQWPTADGWPPPITFVSAGYNWDVIYEVRKRVTRNTANGLVRRTCWVAKASSNGNYLSTARDVSYPYTGTMTRLSNQSSGSLDLAYVRSLNDQMCANAEVLQDRPAFPDWVNGTYPGGTPNAGGGTAARQTIVPGIIERNPDPSAWPGIGITVTPDLEDCDWYGTDCYGPVGDPNQNPDGTCKAGYARGAGYTCQVDTDGNGVPDWQQETKTEEPVSCPLGYIANQTSRQCLLPNEPLPGAPSGTVPTMVAPNFDPLGELETIDVPLDDVKAAITQGVTDFTGSLSSRFPFGMTSWVPTLPSVPGGACAMSFAVPLGPIASQTVNLCGNPIIEWMHDVGRGLALASLVGVFGISVLRRVSI